MGYRVTKKAVGAMFERLAKAMGKTVGYEKGNWYLEHNGIYGGYVIHEILESGGEDNPFGYERRPGREMMDTMYFALRAIELAPTK